MNMLLHGVKDSELEIFHGDTLFNDWEILRIGLPSNSLYSIGISVCILVLKKCKNPDDVLFIKASEPFEKGKRQNRLLKEHIDKIINLKWD